MSDPEADANAPGDDATARRLDALRAAAADGVDFEGLRVSEAPAGYRFETPESAETGLTEAELRDRAAGSPYVRNWHFWEREVRGRGTARRAFLRRAERAGERAVADRHAALCDGVVTEWGQLRIDATLGPTGTRTYEVRHVDDEGVPAGDLDAHDDPRDAGEIARLDADGRYRPLKTAPSLRAGWVFPDLGPRDLVDAVDAFYPATVANWYREKRGRPEGDLGEASSETASSEGELDVDHWLATAERQTGIYDLVDELPREAVEYVAEACCVDSQCLKRREWEYAEGDDLAADPGDGVFPCREPCSLVIAAARTWTKLERESERTYEFALTPSEKEQLESLVDAVADGRVDEIREGEFGDGANRWRARYLRAKRLDDEGNLCGVPTDGGESEE